MDTQYIVISDSPIWIKSLPSIDSKNIGILYPRSLITATELSGSWIKFSSGWVNSLSANGEVTYLETTTNNINVSTPLVSIGSIVSISDNSATYADSGELIPNSVKASTYTVSSLSEDGSIALLDFPAGARILTSTVFLTSESSSSPSTEVTQSDIDKSAADTNKATADTTKKALTASEVKAEQDNEIYLREQLKNSSQASMQSQLAFESSLSGLSITNLKGIYGMPYQYMDIADRRIGSGKDAFGRKYAEKIVARMPLLMISPGLPQFLPNYDSSTKTGLISKMLSSDTPTDLDTLIKRSGKYYTLKYDKQTYFKYVNGMCRVAARFLNIQDTKLDGTALSSFNWDECTNTALHNTLSYRNAIAFFIHSETQVSDSFSNGETQSQLASKVNSLSDMGREMNFLLGTASSQTGIEWDAYTSDRNLDKNYVNNKDFTSKMLGSSGGISGFLKNIGGQLQTISAGGKLIFPNIWSDSNFSRSYDVTIKLTTPDFDNVSWYYNICVPLIHLICLVAPRQSGPNGYISPFLVKAFYKGLFNCDLGLITNMNVNKGSEGGWTRNGLPTTIDVSFTIKDLYESISITKTDSLKDITLLSNMTMMDYIANMCGININKPDVLRLVSMYLAQTKNMVGDTIRLDIAGGFDRWATNKLLGLYR